MLYSDFKVVQFFPNSLPPPLKKGYTILCEMWTRSDPVTEGKTWRLRVTSSQEDLPLCEGEEEEEGEGDEEKEREREKVAEVSITTEFYLKEIRDYCLPDRDSMMFRYSLKAKQECPITVQLTTSKKDAHINLEVRSLPVHTSLSQYSYILLCQVKNLENPQIQQTLFH